MNTLIAIIAAYLAIHPHADINRKDINCMARAVYHEARGEPNAGQSAVAHVILNRVADQKNGHYHPDTICGVVYAPGQFTDLKPDMVIEDKDAWRKAVALSILAYMGDTEDPTKGALWYFNPDKVKKPDFLKPRKKATRLGNHVFYLASLK